MKKVLLGFMSLVLAGGLLTTTSCKKGDQGPKGDSAIANVYYSPWMALRDTGWYFTSADQSEWRYAVRESKIDSSVISTGDVHVYWNVNTIANPNVYNLPFSIDTFYVRPLYLRGGFYLYSNIPDVVYDAANSRGYFRYVITKGTQKTGARTTGGSPVDFTNYNAVKEYYGIKD